MSHTVNHSIPCGKDTPSDLSLGPRTEAPAPFVALDGAETVRHENALSVERTDRGYRVALAVVDPRSLPLFSELFCHKFASRAEWQELRKGIRTASDHTQPQTGYTSLAPTPSFVVAVELSGPDLSVSSCRLSLDPQVQVEKRVFSALTPLMPPHVPDSEIDTSLVATGQLGLALYAQRRERGDVVFADVRHGLLLQPDGSWELFSPAELLGRIATQEITCKVLEGLAKLASSHNIPLMYQGCSEAEPELSRLLGQQLKAGMIKTRADVDRHLVDERAHRTRLLRRREYSATPIPHAGLHLTAYLRMSAPLREFVDCVNLQQLFRFIQGEPPLYSHDEITAFITETSHYQRDRVRHKGDQKYSSLVENGLASLQHDREMSPVELCSFVADCRDGGRLPRALVEYLMHGLTTDVQIVTPILCGLLFSRFVGVSRELKEAAQWIVMNRPDLIDILVQCAIQTETLSMHRCGTTNTDNGGLAESMWCIDGHVYASQRFVPAPQRFVPDLEMVRVQRIQFAKLCGTRYGRESSYTGPSHIFPEFCNLEAELHRRGERLLVGLRDNRLQEGEKEYVLSLSADRRSQEVPRYQATHRGVDWLSAVESAAAQIVVQLHSDSAPSNGQGSEKDPSGPSIERPNENSHRVIGQ